MKKHMIWSNTPEEIEAIAEDMVSDGQFETVDDAWYSAAILANDYLDDERINLSGIKGRIVAVGDFGRWDGHYDGYRIFDSLEDVLRQDMTEDIIELYVDEDGDLVKHGVHHDGMNYVRYYLLPDGIDDYDIAYDDDGRLIVEQEYHVDEKGYGHSVGVSLFDIVESLGSRIADVYGWTA